MPVPLEGLSPSLGAFLQDIEARVLELEAPNSPKLAFACLKAELPAAASYPSCVAYVTDTKILVASDATDWRRQDTGAPI